MQKGAWEHWQPACKSSTASHDAAWISPWPAEGSRDYDDDDGDLSGSDEEEGDEGEEGGVGGLTKLERRRQQRAAGDHPLQAAFRQASKQLLKKHRQAAGGAQNCCSVVPIYCMLGSLPCSVGFVQPVTLIHMYPFCLQMRKVLRRRRRRRRARVAQMTMMPAAMAAQRQTRRAANRLEARCLSRRRKRKRWRRSWRRPHQSAQRLPQRQRWPRHLPFLPCPPRHQEACLSTFPTPRPCRPATKSLQRWV